MENRNTGLCTGIMKRIVKKIFSREEKGRNEVRLAIACFPERLGEVASSGDYEPKLRER